MVTQLFREAGRKAVQVAVGLVVIWAARTMTVDVLRGSLTGLLIGALVIDHLIMRHGLRLPVYAHLARPSERHAILGPTWLLAGALAALWLYPHDIALAAMALMFFGDAAAAMAGFVIPRPKLRKERSFAGSAAMLIVGFAAAGLVVQDWWIAAAMAASGAVVELVSDRIDDNLTVPVLAGLVGHLLA
jgi:dolichol kinase